MLKVVYWEVPAGAITRFQNDQWDHEPVLTLDHLTSKWVPAHIDVGQHIWIQSGTTLSVPMPEVRRPSADAIEGAYAEMMAKARETFIELAGEITPKVYDGTLGLVHRGTMFGTFGFRVDFGLGFTRGNAFDDPPWFRPSERWCPKEIDFGPGPPAPYRRTLWERLMPTCISCNQIYFGSTEEFGEDLCSSCSRAGRDMAYAPTTTVRLAQTAVPGPSSYQELKIKILKNRVKESSLWSKPPTIWERLCEND